MKKLSENFFIKNILQFITVSDEHDEDTMSTCWHGAKHTFAKTREWHTLEMCTPSCDGSPFWVEGVNRVWRFMKSSKPQKPQKPIKRWKSTIKIQATFGGVAAY